MTIHNLMEDFVYSEVNKAFSAAKQKKEAWLTCDCLQCRLDTVCYVLNRIPPRYIKSGRGMLHFMQIDQSEKLQLIADISSLAFEGMKVVLATQRPHSAHEQTLPTGPVFNLPAISGRIVDGQTFTPVTDLAVSLYMENALVMQMNNLWENPFTISEKMPGAYTFWPFPIKAEHAGENKILNFSIRAEKKGYDSINYHFKLGITSDASAKKDLDGDNYHTLPDLYLFTLV